MRTIERNGGDCVTSGTHHRSETFHFWPSGPTVLGWWEMGVVGGGAANTYDMKRLLKKKENDLILVGSPPPPHTHTRQTGI